jgi:hypothetical protein
VKAGIGNPPDMGFDVTVRLHTRPGRDLLREPRRERGALADGARKLLRRRQGNPASAFARQRALDVGQRGQRGRVGRGGRIRTGVCARSSLGEEDE